MTYIIVQYFILGNVYCTPFRINVSLIPDKCISHTWQMYLSYLTNVSLIPDKCISHTWQMCLSYLANVSLMPDKCISHTWQMYLSYLINVSLIPDKYIRSDSPDSEHTLGRSQWWCPAWVSGRAHSDKSDFRPDWACRPLPDRRERAGTGPDAPCTVGWCTQNR
jgi:hypothetical protein